MKHSDTIGVNLQAMPITHLSIGTHDFTIPSSTNPIRLLGHRSLSHKCRYKHDVMNSKWKTFFYNGGTQGAS